MNTKFPTLALSLGFLMSAAGVALGEGTYVYGDGSTKDYMAGVAVPAPMPIPMQEAEWYIRLDIGGSFVGSVDTDVVGFGIIPRSAGEIPTSIFGEAGFGYRFNKNFRADFTSSFHDSYSLTDPSVQNFGVSLSVQGPIDPNPPNTPTTLTNDYAVERTDEYNMRQQSTNLVNFYYDLANDSRFTPYVGAGVGVTYMNVERRTSEDAQCQQGHTDFPSGTPRATGACHGPATGLPTDAVTTSVSEQHEWLFSGALMAGFSYDVNEYIALDAGYRVLYTPGEITRSSPTFAGSSQVTWQDFLHHQFRTGVRLKIF